MYHLFCERVYYPNGGMGDYAGAFDSIEDAIKHASEIQEEMEWQWAHIAMVADGDYAHPGKLVIVAKYHVLWEKWERKQP